MTQEKKNEFGRIVVPCKWCSRDTDMTGTKMCDGCWELDRRVRMDPVLTRKMLAAEFPREKRALMEAIKAYAEAAIADSWKGGGDPADIPEIEQMLEGAMQRLLLSVDFLFGDQPTLDTGSAETIAKDLGMEGV